MERKPRSYRQKDGQAFAVDNRTLKVYRIYRNQVYEVRDAYLRTTVRLRGREISGEEARRISLFDGDLELTLKAA